MPVQTGNSHMALLLAPKGTDVDELRKKGSVIYHTEDSESSNSGDSSGHAHQHSGFPPSSVSSLAGSLLVSDKDDKANGTKSKKQHKDRKGKSSKHSSAASSMAGSHQTAASNFRGGVAEELIAAPDKGHVKKAHQLPCFNLRGSKEEQQQLSGDHVAVAVDHLAAGHACAAAGASSAACAQHKQQQQQQQSHVSAVQYVPIGIITLEDVLEELMQVGMKIPII
jgi:hypothetical protein